MNGHRTRADGSWFSRSAARRRRAVTVGATAVGVLAVSAAAALPAGADSRVAPANNLIVGSGSQADYPLALSLDALFDQAPGCPLVTSTGVQPLDFSCTSTTLGQSTLTPQENAGYTENPVNDSVTEQSPVGSNLGITQLQDQGAHGVTSTVPVANDINYARDSRAAKSSDLKGLNFVAYAVDALSWFHYTKVGGAKSASGKVKDLSKADLIGIWNGTIDNWSQVGGSNAPIVVYTDPEGAGTQSTWKNYLGFDPSTPSNAVNCAVAGTGGLAGTNCAGPEIISQDEDAQIGTTPALQSGQTQLTVGGVTFTSAAQIQADAIFYFDHGNFEVSCGAKGKSPSCGGSPLSAGTQVALGTIDSVPLSEGNILNGTWPVARYLYTVYSNGSNANIPEASAPTLNYVSENGFLCKPQTLDQSANTASTSNQIEDPSTGTWYRTEIANAILAQGFYPISSGLSSGTVTSTPIDEQAVTHGARSLLTALDNPSDPTHTKAYGEIYQEGADTGLSYATNDAAQDTNGQAIGFCLVTSTDGNANS